MAFKCVSSVTSFLNSNSFICNVIYSKSINTMAYTIIGKVAQYIISAFEFSHGIRAIKTYVKKKKKNSLSPYIKHLPYHVKLHRFCHFLSLYTYLPHPCSSPHHNQTHKGQLPTLEGTDCAIFAWPAPLWFP